MTSKDGTIEGGDGAKLHTDAAQLQVLSRLQRLEADVMANDLLVRNLYNACPGLEEALATLGREVAAWAARPTPMAQSDLARSARARVLQLIADIDIDDPKSAKE